MTESISDSFAALVRSFRVHARLSREKLAELAGISIETIKAWESRDTLHPQEATVIRVADVLESETKGHGEIKNALLAAARRPTRQVPASPGYDAGTGTAAVIQEDTPLLTRTFPRLTYTLPIPPTPLLGREQEVVAITALLKKAEARLVTLTGPGGVGKTHLAMQIAADMRCNFPDGVAFVNLAALRDPDLVLPTIAEAMGVREGGSQRLDDALQGYLHAKTLLMVLDNFEQVVSAAVAVAALLAHCPNLKLLVTSRVPLHIRAEHGIEVPPLAVPDLIHLPSLGPLSAYAAVALFVARARQVRADFLMSKTNAEAIATICVRLDGLPLAIELVAAHVRLRSPEVLAAGLDQRLSIAVGGPRDVPARQQTLRATIDWSYDMLDASEQALFARLGVFAGGCTLGAITSICNVEGGPPSKVLDSVEGLLDKSLLRRNYEANGEPHLIMLETIQEYARERLAAGGEQVTLRRAHALYYLALAEQAAPQLIGSQQNSWLALLEREHDNLRGALTWAMEHGESALGLRLAGALGHFWEARGHLTEGRTWVEGLLALDDGRDMGASANRAAALYSAAQLAQAQADYERAAVLFEQSLALSQITKDKRAISLALGGMGRVASFQSDERATAMYEQSLALAREINDKRITAMALMGLGGIAADQADYGRAGVLYEESLAVSHEISDMRQVAGSLINLGVVAYQLGDLHRATALFEESLVRFRDLGDERSAAMALMNLGNTALKQHDYAQATARYEECLALVRQAGDKRVIAMALMGLGNVAIEHGDYARAEASHKESLMLCRDIGNKWLAAYSLESLATLASKQDLARRTVQLYGAASALRGAIDSPMTPSESADMEQDLAAARSALGEPDYATAWADGQALSLAGAIAMVLGEP